MREAERLADDRFDADRLAVARLAVERLAELRFAVDFRAPPPVAPARRFRVAAAFLPAALRFAVDWLEPAFRPPFFDAERFSVLPRPEPDFFPPPDSLLTVAQARASASFVDVPLFLYPSAM